MTADSLQMPDVDPKSYMFANMKEMPATKEIFDALGVDKMCCRTRLLCGIDSKDIYGK